MPPPITNSPRLRCCVYEVGREIKKAIIDKGVVVQDGAVIGYDHEEDARKGYTVTKSGIVIVMRKD